MHVRKLVSLLSHKIMMLPDRVQYPKLDSPLSVSPPKRIGWSEGADQQLSRLALHTIHVVMLLHCLIMRCCMSRQTIAS